EVTVWHSTLPGHRQIAWASPSAVFKHCPVFAKDRAARRPNMKPRRPSRDNIEAAIDTIVDGCAEMAMDERMAVVTRIADALGIATRKPRTKRRAARTVEDGLKQAEDHMNKILGNLMGGGE